MTTPNQFYLLNRISRWIPHSLPTEKPFVPSKNQAKLERMFARATTTKTETKSPLVRSGTLSVNATNTETRFSTISSEPFLSLSEKTNSRCCREDNAARERAHARVVLAPGRLVKRKYYFYTAFFVPLRQPHALVPRSTVFLHPSPQADHPSL